LVNEIFYKYPLAGKAPAVASPVNTKDRLLLTVGGLNPLLSLGNDESGMKSLWEEP